MKRLSVFILTGILLCGLFVAASSVTKDDANKQTVYEHFQFTSGTYSETNFEDAANWSSLGTTNPATNPCASGSDKTCVLRIDQSLITADPDKSLTEELADYLQNISGMTGATDFVNSNYTYRKP